MSKPETDTDKCSATCKKHGLTCTVPMEKHRKSNVHSHPDGGTRHVWVSRVEEDMRTI